MCGYVSLFSFLLGSHFFLVFLCVSVCAADTFACVYLVVTELSTDLQLEYHKALFAGVEYESVKLTTALLFMCSCVVFFCSASSLCVYVVLRSGVWRNQQGGSDQQSGAPLQRGSGIRAKPCPARWAQHIPTSHTSTSTFRTAFALPPFSVETDLNPR